MARVKLTEYRAKKILDDNYAGYSLEHSNFTQELEKIPVKKYVLKVDQGIKKRGKQGLVVIGLNPNEMEQHIKKWKKRGFNRYVIDPLIPHEVSDERYLAIELTREGFNFSYSKHGGINVEDKPEAIRTFSESSLADLQKISGIPMSFLKRIIDRMRESYISFLELNPLVVQEGKVTLLDAAALVDSAGEYFTKAWDEEDVVSLSQKSKAEIIVKKLDDNSPAALKLTVLNKNASIWLLLSGGGASITIADNIQAAGYGHELGNYGEYSGGPTADETYLYTREILKLVLNSKSSKKAIVIAGGVANFTDIAKTFKGIIQALEEVSKELKNHKVKIFVRRGGPNESEGLRLIKEFLKNNAILGSVYGSDVLLTEAASDAIEYIEG